MKNQKNGFQPLTGEYKLGLYLTAVIRVYYLADIKISESAKGGLHLRLFSVEKRLATKTQSHKRIYKLKRLGVLVPLWQKIREDTYG